MKKIWEWLTIFFIGVIGGITFFVKFLDAPETAVTIKKIKNKNLENSDVQQDLDIEVKNTKIKKRI